MGEQRDGDRPRVLILGGGFGGLEAAKAMSRLPAEVVLVDRNNYHLFQPLLYQVASAALSPADIAFPLRSVFSRQKNVTVALGDATAIDLDGRTVTIDGTSVEYDYLIIAAGVVDNYFGHDDWATIAPGMKTLQSAIAIRSRVLLSFEAAEIEDDEAERRALLTFVIVGGGPTGVELAGAIKELAVDAISEDFRYVDTRTTRVVLVEGEDRLLPPFDPALSERARKDLERMGVEIVLGTHAADVTDRSVRIGDEVIESRNIIWSAGVKAVPLARTLGIELGPGGRIPVGSDLSIEGHPEVFAIGDVAAATSADTGKPVPGVAQGAIQGGRYVARVISDEMAGRAGARSLAFRYRDKGSMATIGRSKAVMQIGGWKAGGFLAWLMWCLVHVAMLVGFRNRVAVLFSWMYAYLFFRRGARLITTGLAPGEELEPQDATALAAHRRHGVSTDSSARSSDAS